MSPEGAAHYCLRNYTWNVCLCLCVKMHRKELWCCYQQSHSNKWCSCSTSYPRYPRLFWPTWAAAAPPGESLLASLPLWFASYTLGELKPPHTCTEHMNSSYWTQVKKFHTTCSYFWITSPSDGSVAPSQKKPNISLRSLADSWQVTIYLTFLLIKIKAFFLPQHPFLLPFCVWPCVRLCAWPFTYVSGAVLYKFWVEGVLSSNEIGCVCSEYHTKSSLGSWNATSSCSIETTVCMCLLGFTKYCYSRTFHSHRPSLPPGQRFFFF